MVIAHLSIQQIVVASKYWRDSVVGFQRLSNTNDSLLQIKTKRDFYNFIFLPKGVGRNSCRSDFTDSSLYHSSISLSAYTSVSFYLWLFISCYPYIYIILPIPLHHFNYTSLSFYLYLMLPIHLYHFYLYLFIILPIPLSLILLHSINTSLSHTTHTSIVTLNVWSNA